MILSFSFGYGIWNKYKWDKRLANILLTFYLVFIIGAITIEANDVWFHWWNTKKLLIRILL